MGNAKAVQLADAAIKNPGAGSGTWNRFSSWWDPGEWGRTLEGKLDQAEDVLHVEDKNVYTSLLNTATSTAMTLVKSSLGVLQAGIGSAAAYDRYKNHNGDKYDITIGIASGLVDLGDAFSTVLTVDGLIDGAFSKVARLRNVARVERRIQTLKAERAMKRGQALKDNSAGTSRSVRFTSFSLKRDIDQPVNWEYSVKAGKKHSLGDRSRLPRYASI